jgi:signal transduction histidine kinase
LNDNISRRIREATIAHVSLLLDRIDQAHIDERERIARDLHDQLGEGLAAALRQLELCEIGGPDDPEAQSRLSLAKGTLTGAINRLRAVMSGLRQDSVRSLEKALVQYIDATATEADVRLRVSGDETWAPASVIEEAFLIVREAIRNALRHGAPKSVQIGVVFAPHEIHAWVEDDGRGLGPAPDAGRNDAGRNGTGRSGTGLASMRERASLIGGRLTVASVQDQGTSVELLVPLSGHPDDQRK